jgi:hypothetical protein
MSNSDHHDRPAQGTSRARKAAPGPGWRAAGRLGRPEDDGLVETVGTWAYAGRGYLTQGEAWLALSAAARARECAASPARS